MRIFNTYGPRMRLKDGQVVPAFISQALNQEPVTVFGDGSQTRSFCYVSDLIDGIFRLAMSEQRQHERVCEQAEVLLFALVDCLDCQKPVAGRPHSAVRRFFDPQDRPQYWVFRPIYDHP